ncbi:GDSL-type esterase/lipase family protein [Nocardia sp. NBC_01377]|uniref:SGNH/GDSL hydrolase family protein n=1 Tax=Nocardia sp. NBC_01377 TaxID=2903595 RepID=UPI00324E747C
MSKNPIAPSIKKFPPRQRPDGELVVCLGDSITHGQVSADWVTALMRADPSRAFINAGVGGDMAWNISRRLDAVIALRPDVVTLLVGTNDVSVTFSPQAERMYRLLQRIPQTPNLAWYIENVDVILGRLSRETGARVIVLDIPPVGEDLDSEINKKVLTYNAALRLTAAKYGIEPLPLRERLVDLIPAVHEVPKLEVKISKVISTTGRASLAHAFGKSWDHISRKNGYAFTIDGVHLADRGGRVVEELVRSTLG